LSREKDAIHDIYNSFLFFNFTILSNRIILFIGNCPAGSKINGSECTLCPKKTYQDKPRKTECIECGINLNTVGEGSTSPEACQSKFDEQNLASFGIYN
jgi:hypothetical protein